MLIQTNTRLDEKQLQVELQKELYQRSRSASLSHFLLLLFSMIFLAPQLTSVPAFTFLLVMIFLGIALRYLSSLPDSPIHSFQLAVHHLGSLIIGISWGLLPVITIYHNRLLSISTMAVIIIGSGVATGGSYSLAPAPHLSRIFCVVILLPVTIASIFSEDSQGYLVSILVGVFILFLITMSQNNYRVLKSNLILLAEKLHEIEKNLAAQKDLFEQREKNQQMAKLAALGMMAGGIAHEINNPLAVIMARVTIAKTILGAERDTQSSQVTQDTNKSLLEEMNKIESTCMRVSKIIKGLKAFSRQDDQCDMESRSLKSIIDETLELCLARLKEKKIQLIGPQVDSELKILCRPVQISEIILNLCNNAIDALEKTELKWIQISVTEHASDTLIQIIDSGPGIPPALHEQIFNPFFSTKDPQKGTGLGLSISHQIASSHGAELSLNIQHPNTCFQLRFPKDTNVEPFTFNKKTSPVAS